MQQFTSARLKKKKTDIPAYRVPVNVFALILHFVFLYISQPPNFLPTHCMFLLHLVVLVLLSLKLSDGLCLTSH